MQRVHIYICIYIYVVVATTQLLTYLSDLVPRLCFLNRSCVRGIKEIRCNNYTTDHQSVT